ncbi:MAG: hypothetical protein HQL69_12195 [Magnetococcales bacterium]|nr:hypothetical protein [Magnetococcales bacterium]
MPVKEIVTTLKKGEVVTVMGPGTLEFQAPKVATVAAKAAGAKGAAATGAAATTTVGTTGAAGAAGAGKTAAMTTGASLKALPASLMSGKVLGFSLGAVNPWLLIGVGAVGGYYYCKKKRFSFF